MRVIYLGNFSEPFNTEVYIARAMEDAGHEVCWLNENAFDSSRLIEIVRELVADNKGESPPPLFLFAKGRLQDTPFNSTVGMETLAHTLNEIRNCGAVVACWVFDLLCPEFSMMRYAWASKIAEACDLFFTTDGYTATEYELPNAIVLRQGFPATTEILRDPSTIPVGQFREEYGCLIAHIGSIYGERSTLSRELRTFFGRAYREFEDVRGDDLFDLCATAAVVVGPNYPLFPEYWSNRVYVACGYGACFAAPVVAGMDKEGWQPGVNFYGLPTDPDGVVRRLRDILNADRKENHAIAAAGQQHVLQNLTYHHRVKALIQHVDDYCSRRTKGEPAS